MKPSQRIRTIERAYPDQWVLIEVTRVGRAHQALAGRVLAHASDRATITRETLRVREARPDAPLSLFYTGELIPHGMILALAGI